MKPNKFPNLSGVRGHLAAILVVAGLTVLLAEFRSPITLHTIAMLYLLPVLLSASLWGLGPGLVSAILSFLTFNYFFLPPLHTFTVHNVEDIAILVAMLLVSFIISNLVGRAQRNLAEAQQRQHELQLLYEYSAALGRVNSLEEIAQVIADHALPMFHAEHAQVALQPFPNQPALLVDSPRHLDGQRAPLTEPARLIPLESPRQLSMGQNEIDRAGSASHFWGEIRLWYPDGSLRPAQTSQAKAADGTPRRENRLSQWWMAKPTPQATAVLVEERLARTFAVQGAMTLERAALSEAQTRAQVLEKNDQFKSILLHSVSHELRTPLASIKAAVTGLLNEQVAANPEARHDLLSVVDEESDHLNRLVGNLLDMTRLEAGALKPDLRWNDLEDIVGLALKDLHRSLEGFVVKTDLPEALPLVLVDFFQIERVLVNLLSNSAKFASPGSTIQIEARFLPGEGLHLRLCNEGPQVPEADLQKIFDRFHRLSSAPVAAQPGAAHAQSTLHPSGTAEARQAISGTGLGLSICKGIVEAHGGRIWAENLPNGLAFQIVLPQQSSPTQAPVEEEDN